MGGPSTSAAAYAASAAIASGERQRQDAAVHALRDSPRRGGFNKRRPHGASYSSSTRNRNRNGVSAATNDADDDDGIAREEDETTRFLLDGHAHDDGDDGDDDDDDQEQEARAATAAARERDEMRKHFNFPLDKRRGLASNLAGAVRRKRRLLLRNENLRFRELYKPPEPMVLLIAALLVTIVTLILTKSWPFY